MSEDLPRKHLYQFAHRLFPRQAVERPEQTWAALQGAGREAGLDAWWQAAGALVDAADHLERPAIGTEDVELPAPWAGLALAFPEPEHATEPYLVLLAYTPPTATGDDARMRYFVAERGHEADNRPLVIAAEWVFEGTRRERVRLGELQGPRVADLVGAARPELEAPEPEPADEVRPPRSRGGCIFLALPVAASILIILSYGITILVGAIGTTAGGERVAIDIEGCPEAIEVVQRRVEAIGLGDPEVVPNTGGFAVVANLPTDPDVAATVPDTLVAEGRFEIHPDGPTRSATPIVRSDQVGRVDLTLERLGDPLNVIELDQSGSHDLETWMDDHRDGSIAVWIDDDKIVTRANEPVITSGTIELRPSSESRARDIQVAADRYVRLAHGVLPCPCRVRSVAPVAAPN